MVNFANPQLFYLLAGVVVLGLLYVNMRYRRKKRIARFGNPKILSGLMPDVSKYLPNVKIVVALLALVSMVFMLARPRTRGVATEEEMEGIEVMIAVDVSNSMLASSTDDPKGVSRLNRAKQVLNSLLGKLDNDRVGLIVFAGDAFTQLPLTPDFVSAKLYLNEISTGMVENQGTSIGSAIEVAMNSFSGANDVERAIIVITDAEDQVGDAQSMAAAAHSEGIEVDVIGLGSGKGAQIPLDRTYTNWLKDETGQVVTTYLNEQLAHEIAESGGGVYINGASASALNELVKRLDEIKKSNLGKVNYTANDEQFPVFAWIALILVMIDCILSNRKIGFLRKYNFFSRGGAAVLMAALAVGAQAQTLKPYGQPVEDTSVRKERRLIRQGNAEFEKGHYSEAEILYRRALNENPASEVAQFNQALAQLHLSADNAESNAELLANAAGVMQKLMAEGQNREVAEWSAYNMGNLAFNQQNLQGALEGYKQALRKNPANEKARENMRFVQKQMENQDQNQEQNQDQ
ncbi:MAG: VWA domain-containing protein, partial [Muribaculaceae bacterium]|nr:VWA domain-containing protein [Muribaculaceae bacterium]